MACSHLPASPIPRGNRSQPPLVSQLRHPPAISLGDRLCPYYVPGIVPDAFSVTSWSWAGGTVWLRGLHSLTYNPILTCILADDLKDEETEAQRRVSLLGFHLGFKHECNSLYI